MSELLSNYIISEIDNQKYCRSNGQFTRHLRENNMTYQEYYEKYIIGIVEKCPFCSESKKFYQKDHTYADTCGDPKCVGKQISIVKSNYTTEKWNRQREEYRKTMSEKTDEEIQEMYAKRRIFNLQIDENGLNGYDRQKRKSEETKLRKYGNSKYNNSKQISESKQARTVEQNNKSNEQRSQTR